VTGDDTAPVDDTPPVDDTAPGDDTVAVDDEEATGEEQVANSPRERRLELVVTIVLAVSALFSAWCAYQSSRFSGEQASLDNRAAALQLQSVRVENRALQLAQVDLGAFERWLEATTTGDQVTADFHRTRFRPEFEPAFEQWLAEQPLTDSEAPGTPFEVPGYRLATADRAQELQLSAEEAAAEAERAGDVADRYVLLVVLSAAALFLLGIQTRIGVFELRLTLVAVAGVIMVWALGWAIVLPKSFPF
jgi:hypothetical protein